MKKKNTFGSFIIYFSQPEFIKSVLNLKVLHLCVILKRTLNVIELLIGTESTNSKQDTLGL